MASFEIDRQTIKDLDLFNEDGVSVYSFFNHVKTIGGRQKLRKLMETPSFDINVLISRRDSIQFFHGKKMELNVKKNDVDFIEHYLTLNHDPLKANVLDSYAAGIKHKLIPGKDYYDITQGIIDVCKLFKVLDKVNQELQTLLNPPSQIAGIIQLLTAFFEKKEIQKAILFDQEKDLGYLNISHYDKLFRNTERVAVREVVNVLYDLDVFIAIAKAVELNGFCFPEYDKSDQPYVAIKGLYHPCIKNPVSNDVLIQPDKNICFLTGANMAGKSSYLKALGLAVYLAHVGFPVPAVSIKTTLFKGLITTINISDSITSGYSHYFSEVKRLKAVAEKIAVQDNLFVIFDELFRGTNVKDAYDASLATISALSAIKNSVFLISTHIVEIAVELKQFENISFKYFDSKISDNKPVFDFKIRDGVSSETLGYFIFKGEGILEVLEQAASKQK